ncbi:MAG: FtsX-like permease family protein [Myxococcales bacterium]|nr:FtsX-like permease family protein [Myxococcales bacterium]
MIAEQDLRIVDDPLLRTISRRVQEQWRRVTYQISDREAQDLVPALATHFPDVEPKLEPLVRELLRLTDDNFRERHALFYELIAPRIDLYQIDVGDIVTIRTFTRSGFLKALNVRVYGVFRFAGLEGSDLAGSHNLMDLITFRELYGLMTPAKAKELDRIRKEVGVVDIAREDAEAALFGEAEDPLVRAPGSDDFDEFELVDLKGLRNRANEVLDATYSDQDLASGMALNLAVVADDGVDGEALQRDIERAVDAAGLSLRVEDWQTASGLVGQFVVVIRFVLYIAIAIILFVAVVIVNNSTVTATLERIPEIGTMRAIGAQRGLVLTLFLLESAVLGLLSGLVGILGSSALLAYLHEVGIPAWQPVLVFLFGGPRLYPSFEILDALLALGAIVLVTLVSAVYPAFLAASVQPVQAMQDRE